MFQLFLCSVATPSSPNRKSKNGPKAWDLYHVCVLLRGLSMKEPRKNNLGTML